ncbi:MAG: hypothetical protein H3Z53_07495 [archaeon]|nr:hypothetical protein [archaeon]
MSYIPPPPPEIVKKKGFGKYVVIGLILDILIGSIAGYGLAYLTLSPDVSRWKSLYENKVIEINELQDNYNQINDTLGLFEKQTREVFYFTMLPLYNYKTDEYWYVWYKVKSSDYYNYRFDVETHTPALLEDRATEGNISKTANSWSDSESDVIREIANDLWQVSDGDEEVFVNLAVQLVHQMCYNVTLYTKYPIETIVEGSGDCDNLAVLTASILLAGGFDVIILLVEADGGGHCMLAVSLSSPPDDLYDYGRDSRWYYEYNGEKYYLIEATWGDPGGENWVDPATHDAYNYVGAFVGDNPWESIEVVSVIHPSG